MKTIVCYGDSNTWGFMSRTQRPPLMAENRYGWGVRWTSILQMQLGYENYRIVEEGFNGRTTLFEDPLDPYRNGLAMIDPVMICQMPVDMVILMLGTNDVKAYFGKRPCVIAKGCRRIIDRIRAGGYGPGGVSPEILLVAPLKLPACMTEGWLGDEFEASAIEKNDQLPRYYEAIARETGVHFMNAAEFATACPNDGIHLDEAGHAIMAEKMLEQVRKILG